MLHYPSLFVRQRLLWALLVALLTALLVLATLASPVHAQSIPPDQVSWYTVDGQGNITVNLYFFWSRTCPHCREAHPFVMDLPNQYPWLKLHALELTDNPANSQLYVAMAAALGKEAMYVPAFFYCGQMVTGYDTADTSGAALVENLLTCRDAVVDEAAVAGVQASPGEPVAQPETAAPAELALAEAAAASTITLPLVGAIDAQQMSLPLFTVVLAGLDAFNPCAFFVLLFLLSLMVHAHDRRRMLLIGAVFVFFSGLIYFVFMAAWLNVFLRIGELKLITLIAGLIAVAIALINIKDFFWFKQGVSLSIPASAKPGLYQRMRNLARAGSLPTMLASTAVLAIAANSYELLCTAGFPMVYNRVLTLHDLPTSAYYLYLAAYNIIYVLPLLLIVVLFSMRLGAHKLSENEGRVLKLLSGLMMLLLGLLLIFAPDLLNQVWMAVVLLAAAILITVIVVAVDRRSRPRPSAPLTGRLRPH